jgi:hypothetical protein
LPPQLAIDPAAGNRFDSPLGTYRVGYFGTTPEACFAETLGRLPPHPALAEVVGAEWREMGFMELGAVAADWRHRRLLAHALVPPEAQFVDVEAAQTIAHLRGDEKLAVVLALFGYRDLDLGLVRGPDRRVTRVISQWVWQQAEGDPEKPLYAGIRYLSRLGDDWECWAVFDRVEIGQDGQGPIARNNPALQAIAKHFDLTIH